MSEPTATDERGMDARPAIWQQLAALNRGLSTAQRASVVAAALAVGVGFAWVAIRRSETGYVPLLNGRTFCEDELTAARRRLAAAGLTDFQVEEYQILAPAGNAVRYDAALATDESDATGWAGAWQHANASLSPFATGRQQQDARDIARARLISQLLAQLPDVAQAEIVWDEEPRIGWRQPPRVRATVYLQPRERREVTRDVVEAVKQAVAGSKAHLDPADIVVLDLQRMVAWGSGTGHDETAGDQQRLAVITAAYRQRIEDALADIEGVRIAVAVEPAEAGIPSAPAALQRPRKLQTVSVTPTPSGGTHAQPPLTAVGGPNVRLEVPRILAESVSEIAPAPPAAATVASNQDVHPSMPMLAAPEHVSVTICLAPDYLRRQAESRHTAEAFARMLPAQQRALLADIERAVGRNVRERVAAIIPGESLEDRLARVQVIPQLTSVASTRKTAPEGRSLAASSPAASGTGRSVRWMIGGMIVCLGVWTLYQIARALCGRRRNSRSASISKVAQSAGAAESMTSLVRHSADRKGDPVVSDVPIATVAPTARGSVPERVAELLASIQREDADGWVRDMACESPRVIAALLRQLPPERVADVLAGLSAEVQSDVLAQIAGMDAAGVSGSPILQPVRRQASTRVDRGVANAAPRHRGWFQRRHTVDATAGAADWQETSTMLVDDVCDLDQITELDPVALRTRYAELPVEIWSTALMGASSAFRVRLLSALPAGDAAALRQALTRQRPSRLNDIESAQSQVLALLNGVAAVAAESR